MQTRNFIGIVLLALGIFLSGCGSGGGSKTTTAVKPAVVKMTMRLAPASRIQEMDVSERVAKIASIEVVATYPDTTTKTATAVKGADDTWTLEMPVIPGPSIGFTAIAKDNAGQALYKGHQVLSNIEAGSTPKLAIQLYSTEYEGR